MHNSVMAFLREAITAADAADADIVEIGSRREGESPRTVVMPLAPRSYLGIDMRPGTDVDRVLRCEDLVANLGRGFADLVICTGTLEHMKNWRECLANMILALRHDGTLVLTVPSKGFPRHDYPEDHWRFSKENFRAIIDAAGLEILILVDDPEQPGIMVKARKPENWRDGHDLAWPHVQPEAAPK